MEKMKEHNHDYYLNELVNHLSEIGEHPREVLWIMKDGLWFKNSQQMKLCDLIVVYHDYAIPIELKGNRDKRHKAVLQIFSGKDFIETYVHGKIPYGKFVVYNQPYHYWYETIKLG